MNEHYKKYRNIILTNAKKYYYKKKHLPLGASYWDFLDEHVKHLIYEFVHNMTFIDVLREIKLFRYQDYDKIDVGIPLQGLLTVLPTKCVQVRVEPCEGWLPLDGNKRDAIVTEYDVDVNYFVPADCRQFPRSGFLELNPRSKKRLNVLTILNILVMAKLSHIIPHYTCFLNTYELALMSRQKTRITFFEY